MIKISSIADLQDARYCAAAGADFVGFSLKKEDKNALSPQKIREITAWLSGTNFIIEYNAESVALMEEVHQTMPYYGVEITQNEWSTISFLPNLPLFVTLNQDASFDKADELITDLIIHHLDSKLIIEVEDHWDSIRKWLPLKAYVFLRFPTLSAAISRSNQSRVASFYGICTGKEAFLPSGEGLDYENLDLLFERHENFVKS